jgi:hypothetical protein
MGLSHFYSKLNKIKLVKRFIRVKKSHKQVIQVKTITLNNKKLILQKNKAFLKLHSFYKRKKMKKIS